jgi:hypothetical protein
MSQELKPCPFCNGEAEMRVYDGEYFAQCIQCFCSTAADHQQDSDALTAWNRRPSPVPPIGVEMDNSPDGVKLEVFEIVCKERDRLQAENAALQRRLNIADQRVDDLESDIAAARELLKHGSSPTPAHCGSVLDFLGQTAPVAKGGES